MSTELPVSTRHRRDMTDNVESDVKPEQINTMELGFIASKDPCGKVFWVVSLMIAVMDLVVMVENMNVLGNSHAV